MRIFQWKIGCMTCLCCLILLIVLSPVTAYAHKPLDTSGPATRENPIVVPDHQISWAAYTQLSEPYEVDYYKFTAKKGEEIYGSMVIPKIERLKEFNPMFALIGPGLPTKTEGVPVEEFLEIKDDEGVIVATYKGGEPEVFFEPFTQTRYWVKQELRVPAPEDGTYYFAVFDPTGATGKYVFSIGEKEVWKFRDIIAMPVIWWRTRMFMEQQTSTYIIVVLIVLVLIAILYKLWPKLYD